MLTKVKLTCSKCKKIKIQPTIVPLNLREKTIMHLLKDKINKSNHFLDGNGSLNCHKYTLQYMC